MNRTIRPVFRNASRVFSSSRASKLGTARVSTSCPGKIPAISAMNSPFRYGLIDDSTTGTSRMLAAFAA